MRGRLPSKASGSSRQRLRRAAGYDFRESVRLLGARQLYPIGENPRLSLFSDRIASSVLLINHVEITSLRTTLQCRACLLALVLSLLGIAAAADTTITGNLTVTGDADINGNQLTLGTESVSYGAGLIYASSDTDTLTFHVNRNPGSWLWARKATSGSHNTMRLSSGGQLSLYESDGTTVGVSLIPGENKLTLGAISLYLDLSGQLRTDAVFSADTIVGGAAGLTIQAGGTDQDIAFSPSGAGRITTTAPIATSSTTESTSTTTGALVAAGGLGIAGNQFIGGSINFSDGGVLSGTGGFSLAAGGTNKNITLTPSGTGHTRIYGNIGIGVTDPVHPIHLHRSLTEVQNGYGALFEMTYQPVQDSLTSIAAMTAYTNIYGTAKVVGSSGLQGNLNWFNPHPLGSGEGVLGHFQTFFDANANYLAGFRTSLDHNSSGAINSVYGLYVPQVDIGGSGTIESVYGVSVSDLTGPGKTFVYGIYSGGPSQMNFFQGPVGFGDHNVPVYPLDLRKTSTAVSGSTRMVSITPTYNQPGSTAANTDLLINRTETAVGSGAQSLIEAVVNGNSAFSVSNTRLTSMVTAAVTSEAASVSPSTGALVTTGGLGVGGSQFLGGSLNLAGGTTSATGILFGANLALHQSAPNLLTLSRSVSDVMGLVLNNPSISSGARARVSFTGNDGLGAAESGYLQYNNQTSAFEFAALATPGASSKDVTLTPAGNGRIVLAGPVSTPAVMSFSGAGLVNAATSLTLAAGGANQNVILTPSGSGRVVASGTLAAAATTASTSTSTGSLVVDGGFGLAGDQFIGGALHLAGGSTSATGIFFGPNYTLYQSSPNILTFSRTVNDLMGLVLHNASNSSGARSRITFTGNDGLGVADSGYLQYNNRDAAFEFAALATPGATSKNVSLFPAGNGVVLAGGPIVTTSITASTSTSTGALVVPGGFGLAGDQFVGGKLSFGATGLVTGAGSLALTAGGSDQHITLTPSGSGRIYAAGPVMATSTTASTSTSTGALIVAGGVGVAGDHYVGGSINFSGGGVLASESGKVNISPGLSVASTSVVTGIRTALSTLDFPAVTADGGTQDLTVSVSGAAANDSVQLGLPAAPTAGIVFSAWVSATNTVTIRATNVTTGALNPPSAAYRVTEMSF